MRQCSSAEIPPHTQTFNWRLGVRTAPEKPRHLLIAFQRDRSGNQERNPSLCERISQSVVDIKVRLRFAANVGEHVVAYALVISDRKLKFQSDGKKMNVIY